MGLRDRVQVFDVPALDALFAAACHPDYAPLAYEGIGAIIRIAIFVIAVQGLNILVGYTGQLSLGHAAFMAVGAYSSPGVVGEGSGPGGSRGPRRVRPVAGCAADPGVRGDVVGRFHAGLPALELERSFRHCAPIDRQLGLEPLRDRWKGSSAVRWHRACRNREVGRNRCVRGGAPGRGVTRPPRGDR